MAGGKILLRDAVRVKLVELISSGSVGKGEKLPTEKELAAMWQVNHVTVRAACAELVAANVLTKIPGHGTFFNGIAAAEEENNTIPVVAIMMMEEEHFFNKVRNAMVEYLQRDGFLCRLANLTGHENSSILPELKKIAAMGIEHLVIMQTELEKFPDAIEWLNSGVFKTVVRIFGNGSYCGKLPGTMISVDYSDAFRQRVERMKAAGLRKIAFLGNNCSDNYLAGPANRKFTMLYTQSMLDAGLDDYICVRTSGDDPENIAALAAEADGVICSTDYLAVKLYEAATACNRRVGRELSLVGCYDTLWAEHFNLASLRLEPTEFAARVADTMSRRTAGDYNLKFTMIERNSIKERR